MNIDIQTARRLAARCLIDGGIRRSASTFEWSISGSCNEPIPVQLDGRPEGQPYVTVGPGTAHPIFLSLEVPCRRCAACLRHRAYDWMMRARLEIALAHRTWFSTLTLAPEEQYKALLRARARAQGLGRVFEELPAREQFQLRCDAISRQVTLYLKRVRKQSGAKLRLCLVAEKHKSGDPHWHALIHETSGKVTERILSGQWALGFSKHRLVKDDEGHKHAAYVTKYLSKSSDARVRASLRYGDINALSVDRSPIVNLLRTSETEPKVKDDPPTLLTIDTIAT